MGTITINIDDKTEEQFRMNVKRKFGTKKGALGAAVVEALKQWNAEHVDLEFSLELLGRSQDRGGYGYENREELHVRD